MNDKRQFEVLFYGDVINCVRDETGKEYNLHELINLLMDQQETIISLKEENEQLKKEKEKLVDGMVKRYLAMPHLNPEY